MSGIDPYVYPGTDVLKNFQNERDPERLSEKEKFITLEALEDLQVNPVRGSFDGAHLKEIHRRIFGDIYPFAGASRTIRLTKDEVVLGGQTVNYARPADIEDRLADTTGALGEFTFDHARPKTSLRQFASHMAAIWKVHPFREGNTRAAIVFALQFAKERGFEMDPAALSTYPSETRDALALAAEGDGSKLAPLFHRAYEAQKGRSHPVIGKLTSQASEVLSLMGNPTVTVPAIGQQVRGTVLTTSYNVALINSSKGVLAISAKDAAAVGARTNDRVDLVVRHGLSEPGPAPAVVPRLSPDDPFNQPSRRSSLLAEARAMASDPTATPVAKRDAPGYGR